MLPYTPFAPLTLPLDAPIDLQMHTTFSDARWTAELLLDHVSGENFALIAITDHDRPDTIDELQRLASTRGVRVVPAVEMSSLWEGELCDILCFGIRPGPSALADIAADTRRRQLENVHAAYAALQRNGFQFPRAGEALPAQAGEPRQLDDLIALMDAHGYADGMGEALSDAGFEWITADPGAIVAAAHAIGALALIAHPGRGDGFVCFDPAGLDRLQETVPIDGIEVRHPTHTPAQIEEFDAYIETHNLLASAGSDSHGKSSQMPIKYPAATCRALLERLAISVG
jgi:predicted metal-dependent phosphoesterase TrpH